MGRIIRSAPFLPIVQTGGRQYQGYGGTVMLADEIRKGEPSNVGFKVRVPEKSEKYIKKMDNMTDRISDMCVPQIFPDLGVDTVEGKSLIIVEIYPGVNRPYYKEARKRSGHIHKSLGDLQTCG